MKVFIWENVDKATSSYHPEGGVVVFADNEARARELARELGAIIEGSPDAVRVSDGDDAEAVFIFPNAGCC